MATKSLGDIKSHIVLDKFKSTRLKLALNRQTLYDKDALSKVLLKGREEG